MHARPGSKLFSLADTLTRLDRLSYVLAWTRKENTASRPLVLDLVELPRLNMSFHERKDGAGKTQLYSIDHADLFVSNIRTSLVEKLLRGIPHSLVLQNSNSELQILVPSLRPVRPAIGSSPFSVELVIDRSDDAWLLNCDTNYYL